jgi:hypothetical protein
MKSINVKKPALRQVVQGRQTNHSSFVLPPELIGLEENSLYRYIARWSYIRREYISCDDVALNFGISVRQATNIISIIHRRYSDTISYKIKKVETGRGNVVKTHLLVTDIKDYERKKKYKPLVVMDSVSKMKMKMILDNFLYNRHSHNYQDF